MSDLVCVHCGHCILIREEFYILDNGDIHADCFEQITEAK